jgi:hypothetical protein
LERVLVLDVALSRSLLEVLMALDNAVSRSASSQVGVMHAPTPDQIVRNARNRKYSPAQLAACFTDMPLDIAKDLLQFRCDITETGKLYSHY